MLSCSKQAGTVRKKEQQILWMDGLSTSRWKEKDGEGGKEGKGISWIVQYVPFNRYSHWTSDLDAYGGWTVMFYLTWWWHGGCGETWIPTLIRTVLFFFFLRWRRLLLSCWLAPLPLLHACNWWLTRHTHTHTHTHNRIFRPHHHPNFPNDNSCSSW